MYMYFCVATIKDITDSGMCIKCKRVLMSCFVAKNPHVLACQGRKTITNRCNFVHVDEINGETLLKDY